jgi:hypothetical protein
VDSLDPKKFGLNDDIDFAAYWVKDEPFLSLKNAMYELIQDDKDFQYDYPYDAIFNQVCASGFIKQAHTSDSLIEVRYGWEPLDSSSVIMHSCRGYVVHPRIYFEGNNAGFLLEMEEDEEEPMICFFEYRKIFWVAPIR